MALLQIFRAGTHTAMNGHTFHFSENDLANTAAAYGLCHHRAPLVLGHPKDDKPTYGWVAALKVLGNGLYAETNEVDARLVDWVGVGRYRHVSASLIAPDSPKNPAPGYWHLRHVGFLGAMPPAVKGMQPPAFGEAKGGSIEFQESPLWWDMAGNNGPEFACPPGYSADPVRLAIHYRALAYQKAHGVSYEQAVASYMNSH